MTPFFSVIIPLYNKEDYIEETLQSVLNQTFQDFEIIIVNDGSTDTSLEIAQGINNSRIRIINQKNQGLSSARNQGVKEAKSEYIAFIDADDIWLPHHLNQLYGLISDYPNIGLYCSGYSMQKSQNIFQSTHFYDLPNNFRGIVPDFFRHSLQNCIAWVSAICVPKKVLVDVGGFDNDIVSEQDIDLYIKIALKYSVALDNTAVSAIYNRTMENSLSSYKYKAKIPSFLDTYKKEEIKNVGLKKYLDQHRFAIIIMLKLGSRNRLCKNLIRDIKLSDLNFWQRALIKSPNDILRLLHYVNSKMRLNASFIFKPSKTLS